MLGRGQSVDQVDHRLLITVIKADERLVEQQGCGSPAAPARATALAFSAGHIRKWPASEIGRADRRQCLSTAAIGAGREGKPALADESMKRRGNRTGTTAAPAECDRRIAAAARPGAQAGGAREAQDRTHAWFCRRHWGQNADELAARNGEPADQDVTPADHMVMIVRLPHAAAVAAGFVEPSASIWYENPGCGFGGRRPGSWPRASWMRRERACGRLFV
jgi:hypothetical protein